MRGPLAKDPLSQYWVLLGLEICLAYFCYVLLFIGYGYAYFVL